MQITEKAQYTHGIYDFMTIYKQAQITQINGKHTRRQH